MPSAGDTFVLVGKFPTIDFLIVRRLETAKLAGSPGVPLVKFGFQFGKYRHLFRFEGWFVVKSRLIKSRFFGEKSRFFNAHLRFAHKHLRFFGREGFEFGFLPGSANGGKIGKRGFIVLIKRQNFVETGSLHA